MPALTVPNAAILRLFWSNGPVQFFNVIGAQATGGVIVNQAMANALDTAIKAAMTSSGLDAQLHTLTTLSAIGIRDIRSPNMTEFIGNGAIKQGVATGDLLPLKNALVVTLRTARAGQSFRGRVYISGFTEAANDAAGGAIAAAGTAAVNFVTAIGAALTAQSLGLAVVSRPGEQVTIEKTTLHADGTTDVETTVRKARAGQVTPVTAVTLRNQIWDSQRRRSSAGSASTLFRDVVYHDLDSGETFFATPPSAQEPQGTARSR